MANDKLALTDTAIGVLSFLLLAFGALINKIANAAKEKASFVTRKELKITLEQYAKKESVDNIEQIVTDGIARLERYYIEDKRLSTQRELALIKRVDELFKERE